MIGKRDFKGIVKSVFISIALVLTLCSFGAVFADDGEVPQPINVDQAEISSIPDEALPGSVEEAGSSADLPADEPAEMEPVETDEEVTSGDAVDEAPAAEEIAPQEPVSEIATEPGSDENLADDSADLSDATAALVDIDITLVDEDGAAVDLAAENSLNIVSSADPWWLVGKVKYAYIKTGGSCPADTTAGVTCFESGIPISDALAYMDANNLVPSDGILHVEADTYTEPITIDGTSGNGYLSKMKGLVSEGSSADTFIIGDVRISNTLLGFTLSGFTITGTVDIHDITGTLTLTDLDVSNPVGSGIVVDSHNGTVKVENVKSDNNTKYGLYLDNTDSTASVTVTNSEFSHNDNGSPLVFWGGLHIHTNGSITLNGVSACDNGGNGADLDALKGTTIKNSVFNNNLGIAAQSQYGNGLYIDNTSTSNHILLENVQADGNVNYGIRFISAGKVTLKNVNAYNNGASSTSPGVYIDNRNGTGTVSITNSTFKENGQHGLAIHSHKNVTLNGITALDNGLIGVYVDNCDLSSGVCRGNGAVNISGKLPNYFNGNTNDGLSILSGGNVTLSYFQAIANAQTGVTIENDYTGSSGNVTVNLSYKPVLGTWLNTVSDNSNNGLVIKSFGNILVDKCVFENNAFYAADLGNHLALKAKNVTIRNSIFTENDAESLFIRSKGNVSLYDTDIYKNAGSGLSVHNAYGSGSVSIIGSGKIQRDFSLNGGRGISINSTGVITLKNISAIGNDSGAILNNSTGISKAVSITNVDFSGANSGFGVYVSSTGAIQLTDVVSSNNLGGNGAYLSNETASKAQVVKITRAQFNNNSNGDGLTIHSLGTVTLNTIQASGNRVNGANIDVCQYDGSSGGCLASGGVTITGSGNEFNANGTTGLSIISKNSITLNNVSANENDTYGLNIAHDYANCTGNVKLIASKGNANSFSYNGVQGIMILSLGNITLTGANVNNNHGDFGASLSNLAAEGKTIRLTNCNFDSNAGTGVSVQSRGTITWASGGASENANGNGAYLYNASAGAYKAISVSKAVFNENGSSGLVINASGSITLNNVSGNGNLDGLGADLNNTTGYGNVSVSGAYGSVDFNENSYIGLRIHSLGHISLINANAGGNIGGSGIDISNTFVNAYGNIVVKASSSASYSSLNDNGNHGLNISSYGTVSLFNQSAFGNGGTGIRVTNADAGSANAVSLTRIQSGGNGNRGIEVNSIGALKLSYVESQDNDAEGIWLNNREAVVPQIVMVSRTKVDGNTNGNGLYIRTKGRVTLNNIIANNNLYGAWIDNASLVGEKVFVLSSMGENSFSGNTLDGLMIMSSGNISLSKVTADWNGNMGLNIDTNGSLTANTISLYRNAGIAFSADAYAGMTIAGLQAYNNGSSGDGAGLYINMGAASTAKISKSVITGNYGDGIDLNSGLDVLLLNTYYFGNDINDTGDKNLNLH